MGHEKKKGLGGRKQGKKGKGKALKGLLVQHSRRRARVASAEIFWGRGGGVKVSVTFDDNPHSLRKFGLFVLHDIA